MRPVWIELCWVVVGIVMSDLGCAGQEAGMLVKVDMLLLEAIPL